MVRRGMWDAVAAFEEETGIACDAEDRQLAEQLHSIIKDIEAGDIDSALRCVSLNGRCLHLSLPYLTDLVQDGARRTRRSYNPHRTPHGFHTTSIDPSFAGCQHHKRSYTPDAIWSLTSLRKKCSSS